MIQVTKYTYGGSSACFISNQFDGRGVSVILGGGTHLVPAWSVSILPDYRGRGKLHVVREHNWA